MSNLSSEVVFCRIAAAGEASGCGGVGAFGAGGERSCKLGRVFAAGHTQAACAVARPSPVEAKTACVVFAGGRGCVWAGHETEIEPNSPPEYDPEGLELGSVGAPSLEYLQSWFG